MRELVFLEPNKIGSVPFTTSKVIAEMTGMNHRRVKDAIRKNKADIESFGLLGAYETESSGGRPEEIVKLNEEQATFLMTLLKNTPVVVSFKRELVRQFYIMRRELVKRQVARAKLAPTRRDMTDAIRDNIPASPHKAMWYKHYTDLAYRAAFGKSAAQLRKEWKAPKDSTAADYLNADELKAVEHITRQIGVLVEMGLDYGQIKSMILKSKSARVTA